MDDMRTEVLAMIGAFDKGWTDDFELLHCPGGWAVEDDGRCPGPPDCPDGPHVSPLREAGLI